MAPTAQSGVSIFVSAETWLSANGMITTTK
jgi:hypothetical protein